ncbi:hypothetical protein HNQ60_003717 [Povalibacter uvarum]|uniref:Uncharacterized protein n=1 Tax=Povalibacter uvarum TaxID=732238 RepID=A0A841HRI5_9GAMM|nr:hypothetical protein [Povalibacter uvarum]MBB6094830.1 hypothetical protein [Povalibacter uvarum]
MLKDDLKKLGLRLRPRKVGRDAPAEAPGTITHDERGNAQFEWQGDRLNEDSDLGDKLRKRALSHHGLSIVEDEPPPNAPIRQNPKGLRVGYNPYESGMLAKKEWKPKRDLRELSKWIEAKKRLDQKPSDDE